MKFKPVLLKPMIYLPRYTNKVIKASELLENSGATITGAFLLHQTL